MLQLQLLLLGDVSGASRYQMEAGDKKWMLRGNDDEL